MTAREWILKCFAAGVASSKKRESMRAKNVSDSPSGKTVRKKKTGEYVTKPWPPPRPIGCSPKKIFGDDKKRPAGLGIVALEKELAALRAEGVLAFTSGVWWKR